MSETKNILEKIKQELPLDQFEQIDGCNDAVIGIQYGTLKLIYSYNLLYNLLISQGKDSYEAKVTIAHNSVLMNEQAILCYDKFEE